MEYFESFNGDQTVSAWQTGKAACEQIIEQDFGKYSRSQLRKSQE